MARMEGSEWKDFVLERPRTAKLATVRRDGRPHVAPVWIDLDDDDTIVFTTSARSVKGRAIRRDPRVALCVDDETPPFSFVIVEGRASASEDLEEMLVWATRIAGRYMGADLADAYGRRNAVAGELLVRVTPERVIALKDIAR
jgi:PPOX class probable F420-dependent enzyme